MLSNRGDSSGRVAQHPSKRTVRRGRSDVGDGHGWVGGHGTTGLGCGTWMLHKRQAGGAWEVNCDSSGVGTTVSQLLWRGARELP